MITIAVVQNSLMIDKIMLPFDSWMNGVIMIKVECRTWAQSPRFIILEMKIRFPEDGTIRIFSLEIVAEI